MADPRILQSLGGSMAFVFIRLVLEFRRHREGFRIYGSRPFRSAFATLIVGYLESLFHRIVVFRRLFVFWSGTSSLNA